MRGCPTDWPLVPEGISPTRMAHSAADPAYRALTATPSASTVYRCRSRVNALPNALPNASAFRSLQRRGGRAKPISTVTTSRGRSQPAPARRCQEHVVRRAEHPSSAPPSSPSPGFDVLPEGVPSRFPSRIRTPPMPRGMGRTPAPTAVGGRQPSSRTRSPATPRSARRPSTRGARLGRSAAVASPWSRFRDGR